MIDKWSVQKINKGRVREDGHDLYIDKRGKIVIMNSQTN